MCPFCFDNESRLCSFPVYIYRIYLQKLRGNQKLARRATNPLTFPPQNFILTLSRSIKKFIGSYK